MMEHELSPEERQRQLRVVLHAEIARASDEQLAEDSNRVRELGESLAKTGLDRTQIRNLENLAYTTDKVSDITDLLKKSIGRDSRNRSWAKDHLGRQVIEALMGLRKEADQIAKRLTDEVRAPPDTDLPRRVHLELCREFVKHLAAEFLYQKREAGNG